jgi:hypothetical protein
VAEVAGAAITAVAAAAEVAEAAAAAGVAELTTPTDHRLEAAALSLSLPVALATSEAT